VDEKAFAGFGSALLQGASFEGVYNGLTHSAEQRAREEGSPASPQALAVFARELAILQSDLPKDRVFGKLDSRPLPTPEELRYQAAPETEEEEGVEPEPLRVHQRVVDSAAFSKKAEVSFRGASLFTLKRVLGDEVLLVIERLEKKPALLSEWYGEWAARLAKEGVDFGLPKRMNPDPKFHADWAQTSGNADFLRWECLNRVHRLLNARNP
jgi:hypothetical protein